MWRLYLCVDRALRGIPIGWRELLSARLPVAVNASLCCLADSGFHAAPVILSVLRSSSRRRLSLGFVVAVTLERSVQAVSYAVALVIEIVSWVVLLIVMLAADIVMGYRLLIVFDSGARYAFLVMFE